jgi:Reverse transcriptase (RNA-dependent DNA polymerase)
VNGPSAFVRLMQHVLGDIILAGHPLLVFFDDIVIGGSSLAAHKKLLVIVVKRLREHPLVIKSHKARICMREARVLGFRINEQGVFPEEDKLEATNE